jgi:lysophospholipase L1-like esterase
MASCLAAAAVVTACVPEAPPADPPPTTTTTTAARPTAIIYGDSIVGQATPELRTRFEALLPGWRVIIAAWGGTAQCDWHDEMQAHAATYDVRLVVVSFTGNRMTECITSRATDAATTAAAYAADAAWAADFWAARDADLVFVAGPTRAGAFADPYPESAPDPTRFDTMRQVYRTVAAERGVAVADVAPLLTDPATGRYAVVLPCLVGECEGTVTARASDGVHLCDDSGPPSYLCASGASGVVRFVDPIVQTAAAVVGVVAPPPRTMG